MLITKTTHSPEETIAFAGRVGELLKAGDIIAYRGDLGAGKTTFTRGVAVGMGLDDDVTSPTFALVNEYRKHKLMPLVHFDMYRITDSVDLEVTGFYDYIDEGVVVAVEWSENIEGSLPDSVITITLERVDDTTRRISINTENGDERFADFGD